MKLLLLTVDYAPIEGGIASLSGGLAAGLARRGHAVTVLAPARPGARHTREQDGVRVERWAGYDLGAARLVPFVFQALARLRGFDALLAMNPAYGGTVAALARRLGGPPYLAWAYGFELLKARGSPLAPLYRQVFARSRGAVAISRYTASLLAELGVAGERIVRIPPGVDPPPAAPVETDALRRTLDLPAGEVVLTVGRLVPRKGHLVLLEAVHRATRRRPALVWVVAGRGPIGDELRRRAAELGIAGNLRLVGYAEPAVLEALYRLASVFALTPQASATDGEGFGIVFLEAGARGLPVVAGRSGGVPDAVLDGTTGVLVDPHDPSAIAAALLDLLDRPDEARRLGASGLAHARAHSWDRAAAAVEARLAGDGGG